MAEQTVTQMLNIDAIVPAQDNPRKTYGQISELAASIKAQGIIQPLVVTPREVGFLVVTGHRRLMAAKHAGLREVPCIVREIDDQERLEVMLVENVQREDLNPIEEARGYAELQGLGLKQQQIAMKVGKSQSHIAKRLKLLSLSEDVQQQIAKGELAASVALEAAQDRQSRSPSTGSGLTKEQRDERTQKEDFVLAMLKQPPADDSAGIIAHTLVTKASPRVLRKVAETLDVVTGDDAEVAAEALHGLIDKTKANAERIALTVCLMGFIGNDRIGSWLADKGFEFTQPIEPEDAIPDPDETDDEE